MRICPSLRRRRYGTPRPWAPQIGPDCRGHAISKKQKTDLMYLIFSLSYEMPREKIISGQKVGLLLRSCHVPPWSSFSSVGRQTCAVRLRSPVHSVVRSLFLALIFATVGSTTVQEATNTTRTDGAPPCRHAACAREPTKGQSSQLVWGLLRELRRASTPTAPAKRHARYEVAVRLLWQERGQV
jgi:hypothetical protein